VRIPYIGTYALPHFRKSVIPAAVRKSCGSPNWNLRSANVTRAELAQVGMTMDIGALIFEAALLAIVGIVLLVIFRRS
jgi:hypothetical protein